MDNSFLSDSLGPLENADCKLISADLCQCHPGSKWKYFRNTDEFDGNSSVLRTAIRHTDYRAKKNLYPPRIGHVLTFGLAPYILYMYKPSIRVSKGFF